MAEVGNQQRIRHYLDATKIGDHHTDVGVFQFEDKLFVILTQYEKIGTLVLAKADRGLSTGSLTPDYHISILLGKDEANIHAFARVLAERLNISQPLLLGLAIKDGSNTTILLQQATQMILNAISKMSK